MIESTYSSQLRSVSLVSILLCHIHKSYMSVPRRDLIFFVQRCAACMACLSPRATGATKCSSCRSRSTTPLLVSSASPVCSSILCTRLVTWSAYRFKLGTFGTGQEFVQETRKDICVKGPLVAFAGTANNSEKIGMNPSHQNLIFSDIV